VIEFVVKAIPYIQGSILTLGLISALITFMVKASGSKTAMESWERIKGLFTKLGKSKDPVSIINTLTEELEQEEKENLVSSLTKELAHEKDASST